jgi:Cu2+-exporting ATPase
VVGTDLHHARPGQIRNGKRNHRRSPEPVNVSTPQTVSAQNCYHCGLPIPAGTHYPVEIEHTPRNMCCRGCQAVAEAIVRNGLADYYRHRTALPQSAQDLVPDALRQLVLYDHPDIQKSFVRDAGAHTRQASLILEGITCAACIWLNERHLQQLPGVIEVQVNYTSHRARVTWDEQRIKLSDILKEIQLLGYHAHPFSAEKQETLRREQRAKDLRRIAVAGICSSQVMMLSVALYAGVAEPASVNIMRYTSLLLTLPVALYAALPFHRSALSALRGGRLNMDVPVSLAIIAAFVGSVFITMRGGTHVYYDAVNMFALFLLTTRFLEHGARQKSAEAAENLLKLAPVMATRVRDLQHEIVAVLELEPGDIILTKPGEAIAADAEVVEGESTVNEALLTGESRAVAKACGSTVIAGSINLEGPLTLRVTGLGENTVLAGIVRLLDRAQAEKPSIAQLADRVAAHFTAALLLFSIAAGLAWWWFDPARAFEIVLAVLVVSCPCALSLAAPAAMAAASSRLLKRGVLITSGHALETLAHVSQVVFDKTGTLTFGKPVIQKTLPLSHLSVEDCLRLAASLERASEHPLAASFMSAVEEKSNLFPVDTPQNIPGKGVAGIIDGKRYTLGNRSAAAPFQRTLDDASLLAAYPNATLVWLCDETHVLAAFAIDDEVRPAAAQAVAGLKKAGIKVCMLSGDAAAAVAHIAANVGIDNWQAGLRPEEKVTALQVMQRSGEIVAMVGDGVNDAPVLAGAQVSIAMGGGTQVARAASDIILLSENLSEVNTAITTARTAATIMRQNLAWAVVYNLVALPFAALGYISPWLAALGMSLSSLIVVLNALRLR